MKKPLFTLVFSTLALTTACDGGDRSDSIEASAAKLAELHGLDDYEIVVVPAPEHTSPADGPAREQVDPAPTSTEPSDTLVSVSDPEEMPFLRCYEWQDGSGCSTCVVNYGGCTFWASDCLDGSWSNC